jgi:glycosyltransferase involved in cell wall biosynthesis
MRFGAKRGARARRVLIIVQNLPVPDDRRVWLECRSLRDAGIGVSVICPKGEGDPAFEELDGVRIYKYDPPEASSGVSSYFREFLVCWLKTARLSWRVWRRDGFSVIQTCNPPDTYFALAWLYKPAGVKFVFDQHDLCPETYQSRFGADVNPVLLRGLRLLERLQYATADRVISTNESYRAKAMTRGHKRPDAVTVVRSGPDPKKLFRGDPDPALRNGHEHLCVYIGVMGPQDRVDLLVLAADHMVHTLGRTDTQFALLGGGDCLEELQAQVRELALEDHVEFVGWVKDDAVTRAYFSTADLGLAPDPRSPLNDISTHNKVMEYMACELPVVTFPLVETRVSAEDAAYYVEPDEDPVAFADAVCKLLDDPEARARMGALGRERVVSRLAWEHQAAAYVDVFESLLGDAGAASTECPPAA